jgi:hypothetical protein
MEYARRSSREKENYSYGHGVKTWLQINSLNSILFRAGYLMVQCWMERS